MPTIITRVWFDVNLSDEERKAIKKLLDRPDVEVQKRARLAVNVEVKVEDEEKKP